MRILIIEDDETLRAWWIKNLKPLNCTVDEAGTIEAALEQMRRVPPPDILFLDLRLPDSPVFEQTLGKIAVFKEIHPNALVVVATGYATEKIKHLAFQLGADAFSEKIDMNTQSGLFRVLKAVTAKHPKGSRESVEALGEFQEALSKLLPA